MFALPSEVVDEAYREEAGDQTTYAEKGCSWLTA
jgi:hypothetical protein